MTRELLAPVRYGLLLGILAVLYGWGLGVAFGIAEDRIREGFLADAKASRDIYFERHKTEEAVTAAITKMDETCWRYFQRAHLHAGAIGSIAIGASVVLALLSVAPSLKRVVSLLLGLGALGYPLFWMLAGMKAPGLGTTAAAKESLLWLALPSVGALATGGLLTLALVVFDLFRGRESSGASGKA